MHAEPDAPREHVIDLSEATLQLDIEYEPNALLGAAPLT